MSLCDPLSVRKYHNSLAPEISDDFIDDMIFNAESMMRDWIGDTDYDAVERAFLMTPEVNIEPALLRKYKRYRNAEKELAMYQAVPKVNVVVTTSGVIKSATSQKFGDATFTIATTTEITQLRSIYFQEAERLVYGNANGGQARSRIGGQS